MSITLSNKEVELIKKSLNMLKAEVIVHPKKHWETNTKEIIDLISLIDNKKMWQFRFLNDNNDKDSE